jgi:hypothetical protein
VPYLKVHFLDGAKETRETQATIIGFRAEVITLHTRNTKIRYYTKECREEIMANAL